MPPSYACFAMSTVTNPDALGSREAPGLRRGMVSAADEHSLILNPPVVKAGSTSVTKRDRGGGFRTTCPQPACQEPVASLFFALAPGGDWRLTRCRIARASRRGGDRSYMRTARTP